MAGETDADGIRRWRLVRAGRDAVPPSVRRFMRRARRRRLKSMAPWGIGALVVALGAVAAWVLLATSVFGVDSVRVSGVAILHPDEVVAAAAIPLGTPLLKVDLAAVRDRVAALVPAADAVVSRSWPHEITIAVTERTAVAAVPREKKFSLVDAAGVAFLTVDERPAHLPLVRVGEPGPDDPETMAAIAVLSVLTPQLRDQLVTLVVDAPARIRLELRRDRVVLWGDTSEGDLKARVATALLNRPGKTIDVTAPEVVTIS
ncbi:cell division protein FtsQ [Allocatelliglobosispora scoriae]|uniref:Cell division protein FtsQ n=1 Tax=Allocatelliglobosispora scoriae TaxID=643052 RepID=A0A841BPY7_9ACTN|nr:FtsQ-type POTRA domain-containing protein [Allocatelliglobosispora scoriae]MBB5869366.1 cell division protein FtsQ [Allocatelliglobosispora scoriae]